MNMATIDPRAVQEVETEILPGKNAYWAAFLDTGAIFRSDHSMMVPFSHFWGGFSIFCETGVLG
jgi:hypothetical protein